MPASANFRVLGSMVNFNGEPEAAEVPKAGASLVSLGAGFGSKSAAMYQIKYTSKVPEAKTATNPFSQGLVRVVGSSSQQFDELDALDGLSDETVWDNGSPHAPQALLPHTLHLLTSE